jgi:hypothetical protein
MRRLILFLLFIAPTLLGQDVRSRRSVLFYWENDSLGSAYGAATDDDYTNGLRLAIGSPGEHAWARRLKDIYCRNGKLCIGSEQETTVSYAFGHQFYTPRRITLARPQPLDRPWAGYMYLGANAQFSTENVQHSFEGQVGILGQGAGAQYVQSRWHQFIGSPNDPAGWHHQLKNEPVLNLYYTHSRRYTSAHLRDHADFVFSPGASVGTFAIYPSVGGTLRAGYHVTGFPTPPIPQAEPEGEANVEVARATRARTEAWLQLGADARYVLHNATIDGGTFRDGPSVERTPFVHDYRMGFSVRRSSLRVSYNFVIRSHEFTPPPGRQDTDHRYHSLAVGWEPAR